jgi:N-methylhydantoinase A
VHGYGVARILHLPRVISPPGAGVGSTFGLLVAPLAFDFVRSVYGRLDALDWDLANNLLVEMEVEGRAILERSGVTPTDISFERTADMRYLGQGHEVSVPLPAGTLDPSDRDGVAQEFDRVYRERFGRQGPDVPLEIINWRVVASGPRPTMDLEFPRAASGSDPRKGSREAYFAEAGGYTATPVLDRYALGPGATFEGPAIVEERESTLVVGPGARAHVDEHLNVIVEPGSAE